MPVMEMLTSSPRSRVNSSGGTIPVPVKRSAPLGNSFSLNSHSARLSTVRAHLRERGRSLERDRPAATDDELDLHAGKLGHRGHRRHHRPDRARTLVDLRLRQVERVLALDVARTHVVADGVADDLPRRRDDQRQFRLGHAPLGVGADAHRFAGGGTTRARRRSSGTAPAAGREVNACRRTPSRPSIPLRGPPCSACRSPRRPRFPGDRPGRRSVPRRRSRWSRSGRAGGRRSRAGRGSGARPPWAPHRRVAGHVERLHVLAADDDDIHPTGVPLHLCEPQHERT